MARSGRHPFRSPWFRRLVISLTTATAGIVGFACSSPPPPADTLPADVTGKLEFTEPKSTYLYMVEALAPTQLIEVKRPETGTDRPPGRLNRMYYLLSATIRDRITYVEFVANWEILRPRFVALFRDTRFVDARPIADINGRPAAELLVRRPGSGATGDTDTILVVQEFDPLRWPNEMMPPWRLRGARVEALFDGFLRQRADSSGGSEIGTPGG